MHLPWPGASSRTTVSAESFKGPLFRDTCIRTAFPVLSLNPTFSYTVPEYNLDLSKELPALETHC